MDLKTELRDSAKKIRNNIEIGIISHKIVNNFVASSYYKNNKNVAIYYPYGTEVNLIPIFKDKTKNFYIPKIFSDNSMTFHKYTLGDELVPDKYGIMEPTTKKVNPSEFEIIVLPALMADMNGFRLGYGKGYYDKFLSEYNLKIPKIVLLPEALLCEKLPSENFDVPLDVIITENKTIIISKI